MSTRISADWQFRNMQAVIMENKSLRVVILPGLGAKIWQITYKPKDLDVLWQHPRMKPKPVLTHNVYDDHFFGGWDELFPNDIPEEIAGEPMPDHGEIWTLPWNFEVVGEDTLHLWVDTVISCCRLDKWITLAENESILRFQHKITNTGQYEQPFLWKLHAAMQINENSRIDMGAKTVLIDSFGSPRTNETGITYTWPYANGHDMREILPATSRKAEFQFATEMEAGWCSLTHMDEKIGFGLAFDLSVFPSCWTFASYGGWRNLNTIILEPCTGHPVSVNEGLKKGTHQVLLPGQSIETNVLGVIYTGLSEVHGIDVEGNVTGH